MKKLVMLAAALVILSLILACGQTPAPSPTPSPTPAPKPSPTPPPATVPPTPSPVLGQIKLTPNPVETSAPKYGGILRFDTSAPAGFDMHMKHSYAAPAVGPVFNTLLNFNLDYVETVAENLVPELAASWKVAPDNLSITLNLVKGVKWHDGKPFTADDVVYSIEKIMDPKRSVIYSDFPAYSSVEKLDDYTVKINLKYPSPSFLLNLAAPYSVIQPKHLASVDSKSTDFVVGTGPFKFKNYTKDSQFDLVRNPDYWKKDKKGNQLPYLDGVSLYIMSVSSGFNAFVAGRLDIANPATGIGSPESLKQVKEQVPGVVLFKTPTGSQPYLWSLNFKNQWLKDARIRRAITLMFDPKEQAIARSGSTDFLDLTRGFFPPAWGLPADEIAKTLMWDQPFEKRIEEAKRLVKEAGYTGGLKVRVLMQQIGTTGGGGIAAGATVALDHMKKDLNFDGEIVALPSAEYAKARQDGNWEMLSTIVVNTIGDPDQHMAYFKTGTASNPGGYSNPDVDKMWDQQAREMDPAKRRDILLQIERKLLADLPAAPGFFQLGYKDWYPYVKNVRYATSVYAANIRLEEIWTSK